MRVRLSFEEGILGPSRKLWIDYADQTTVLEFIKYVKNTFDIKQPLEIWLDGFFVHTDLEFSQAFKQAEILFVKIKDDFVKIQSDLSVKALKNKDEKMKGKNLKKELKKNPKAAEFQGTKYKFDEKGNIKEVVQIRPELNVPTPAEEYEMKRAEWKIKPIPKRKPFKTFESKAPAMLEDKRNVLPHQLNVGDKISFSTIDSNFIKRGLVKKIENKSVNISVTEDFGVDPQCAEESSQDIIVLKAAFREIELLSHQDIES